MARITDAGASRAPAPPDPWDPFVRLSHWTLAAAVIADGLLTKAGGTAHVWIGWAALGMLALRLAWGLFGPAEARFAAFPPDPRAAIGHLADLARGRPRGYASHNPAGALMVYALWAAMAVTIGTGLWMTDFRNPIAIAEEKAAVAAGDWSVLVRKDGAAPEKNKLAEAVHETAANLMLILALVHVAGVAVESRALGRSLVRPMVTGRKR